MAGLMELLFGPDGIGGQPGLAGKAGNAIWQGTGELPEGAGFGKTLANSLGNIPHVLTDIAIKNPLEILKNPSSALNDRGEVSITRLLFPEFRRERVKEAQQQAKFRDAYSQAQVMNAYDDILAKVFGPASGMSPAEGSQEAQRLGVPADIAQREMQRDYAYGQQMQGEQQKLQAAGLPANIAAGLTGTPEEQANAKILMEVENHKAVDARARAKEAAINARALARGNKDTRTDAEKKLDAYRRAEASGDPVAIATTRAALEGIGKSGQTMVVTRPDGSVVAGPASEVSGFESASARDRALAMVDANDSLLATIRDAKAIAEAAPEAFGATGAAAGFAQNLKAQSAAFRALQDRIRGEVEAGLIEPEPAVKIMDSFISEIPTLNAIEMTLAAAKARAMNPEGRISDADFNNALRIVRGGTDNSGWLANAEAFKATLALLEKDAEREKGRARFRARKSGKDKNPVAAAIEGTQTAPKKKPFGKKNRDAEPGTTRGGEIPDSELRLLRDSKALEDLSDPDYERWKKLNGLGQGDGE